MPSGHDAAVAEAAPVPEAAPLPAEVARLRALSLLRRLAFGMQRCVAKSNGEMAYQLLFQQEQLVSYSGYNMFFRFVPYAMFRCRAVALDAAAASAPHLKVLPLEPVEAEETDAIPAQEVAEVFDEEDLTESGIPTGGTRVVSHNQKDDYLHRGASAVMTSMSLVMYSRYVRRVPRSQAGRVDYVKFFPFDEHYAHFPLSVQDCCFCLFLFLVADVFCCFMFKNCVDCVSCSKTVLMA